MQSKKYKRIDLRHFYKNVGHYKKESKKKKNLARKENRSGGNSLALLCFEYHLVALLLNFGGLMLEVLSI